MCFKENKDPFLRTWDWGSWRVENHQEDRSADGKLGSCPYQTPFTQVLQFKWQQTEMEGISWCGQIPAGA